MGNQRIFLWAALALILWLCYEAWIQDYHPRTAPPAAEPEQTTSGAEPTATAPGLGEKAPELPATAAEPSVKAAPGEVPAAENAGAEPVIRVVTDVLDMDIGLKGGTLRRADIPDYPREKDKPEIPVRLFEASGPHPYLFQSGLIAQGPGPQPDHLAVYSAQSTEYQMAPGQDELKVPLVWRNDQGLEVVKTFTFRRGSYAIDLTYEVRNHGDAQWHCASYMQFLRQSAPVKRSMWNVETYAFRGPAIYDGTRYSKLDIEDEDDTRLSIQVTNGWVASMQHHFVAAAVPQADQPYQFTLQANLERDFLLRAVGPTHTVAPGAEQRFAEKIFVGPKLQSQLKATGPELQRTADYGKLTIIAQPLFTLMQWIHRLIGNWGWTIVIVTFLIKLVFYPLSEASGRSMARMRVLAPRIKNIQERYKDNREQLGRAMMDLYKREKVNPLAGCLPMLVQIPVFLAFYWVLLESVELRQAPFILWINDLSARDPYFILPVLMGASMFGQFKLNPAPPDPMQAKIFMIMPIVMTVMFAFFPSGLVLYWLTNTLLSIAQQWNINRRIEAGKKAA